MIPYVIPYMHCMHTYIALVFPANSFYSILPSDSPSLSPAADSVLLLHFFGV